MNEPEWFPCAACKAPIFSAYHERTGTRAPLLRPREGGLAPNITIRFKDGRWLYHVINKKERESGMTGEFISHFADCYAAQSFRRPVGDTHGNNQRP